MKQTKRKPPSGQTNKVVIAMRRKRRVTNKKQEPLPLREIFDDALQEFWSKERANIIDDISERNLCGRLALYLEGAKAKHSLTGYYADTEYNRKKGGKVKTVLDSEMKVVVIYSDLILHSRGENVQRDNLIAIEMKKSGQSKKEKLSDRERLRAMTKSSYDSIWSSDGMTDPEHVCGYEIGFYLELDVKKLIYFLEEYQRGELVGARQGRF